MRLPEFIEASGLSERQIHYWRDAGVLRGPSHPGSGVAVDYPVSEVLVARALSEVTRAIGRPGLARPILSVIASEVRDHPETPQIVAKVSPTVSIVVRLDPLRGNE